MARQILRYKDVVTFDAVEETVLYTAFPAEDEGQSMPTFTEIPFVSVITANSNREVRVIATTTTSVTFRVGDGSDAFSTIEVDVQIVSRESTAITGPTPSTDFTAFVPEPLVTPVSILIAHSQLSSSEWNYDRILGYCQDTRSIIDTLSKYYTETTLKGVPWCSPVYKFPLYRQSDDYPQDEPSNAVDSDNRPRCLGVQPASSAFTDMYTITFTNATAFSISGLIQGSMGSGNTSQTFTAGNGDFTIVSDAWVGTFQDSDRFGFELNTYYRLIHRCALMMALGELLLYAYGEESAEENKVGSRLISAAQSKLKALNMPYDDKVGLRLPSKGKRSLDHKTLPYDVDMFGRNLTKIRTGNLDADGNRGEGGNIYHPLLDLDFN